MFPSRAVRRCLVAGLFSALGVALVLLDVQAQTEKGKKYALLVGVTEYDSTHFARLRYTENDVEDLAKLLNQPSSGFATVRVLTTTRGKDNTKEAPTAANIRKALDELLDGKTKHDVVLLALSGHGAQLEVKDPDGEKEAKSYPYFCPSDASLRGIKYSTGHSTTLIHLDDAFEAIGKCDAGAKLVLIDACRNELQAKASTRSLDVAKVSVPRGVGVLFSCKPGQKAFETEDLGKGHGVFFHFVLQGMRGEAKNRRGAVTWDSLAAYVKEEVSQEVEQIIGGGARQNPHLIANIVDSPVLALLGNETFCKESVVKEKQGKAIVNSIGMKLVRIEPGTFMKGSPTDEKDRYKTEGPQHEVEITKAFYMGVYAVTQAEYKVIVGGNPSWFSADGGGKAKVSGMSTGKFPVETVSCIICTNPRFPQLSHRTRSSSCSCS